MEGYVGVLYEEVIGRNIVEQPSAHSHRFVQISPLSLARLKLSCAGFVNAEGTQEPGYAPRTTNPPSCSRYAFHSRLEPYSTGSDDAALPDIYAHRTGLAIVRETQATRQL